MMNILIINICVCKFIVNNSLVYWLMIKYFISIVIKYFNSLLYLFNYYYLSYWYEDYSFVNYLFYLL